MLVFSTEISIFLRNGSKRRKNPRTGVNRGRVNQKNLLSFYGLVSNTNFLLPSLYLYSFAQFANDTSDVHGVLCSDTNDTVLFNIMQQCQSKPFQNNQTSTIQSSYKNQTRITLQILPGKKKKHLFQTDLCS